MIFIDGNSYLNAALLGGVDHDEGRKVTGPDGKTVQVNGYQYGVDKFFDRIQKLTEQFDAAPRQMILVWDGKNAKQRRRTFLENYKAGRDKIPEVNEQLNKARELCTKMALDLGMHVASQTGFEGDDVLGYLAKTLRHEPNIVATEDGDMSVLVDENTSVWRLGEMSRNPYGPFPHKFITLYKALVGDTGDKIPGAPGFGPAAWDALVLNFGIEGLEEMQRLIENDKLDELKENVADLKVLQKVIDGKDLVSVSWRVARLHVEEINTMQKPLQLQAGMVKQWGESDDQVHELRKFYGTKTLVTAENYAAIYERLARNKFEGSPFIALDIETSSSEESDEWMEALKKATDSDRERIDVLGHELTGMSLTFGANTQHTIYMTVDHKDSPNITVDQCRAICELIPHQKIHTIIQNRSFEFSVLYRTWGSKWKDNGWFGFVPNALDTKLGASYVDENLKKGLKDRSLHHLGYTQATYEETTCKSAPVGELSGGEVKKVYEVTLVPAVYEQEAKMVTNDETGEEELVMVNGKLLEAAVTQTWETRQYKMRELTAAEVFDYGCDDTICTAALHTHYQIVMLLENTWHVFLEVETLPEYLTSLAFVQGVRLDMPALIAMEKRDDVSYDAAWQVLRDYLLTKGWDGTVCPEFEGKIEPADAKMAVEILLDDTFGTRKRKLDGIALDIREHYPDNATAGLLAAIIEKGAVDELNALIKQNFTGEPKINFGSPKQMQNLFYKVIGITPRIVNKLTDKQREIPVMASAFKKRRLQKQGKDVEFTPEEHDALISKASTDDTAVATALAMDDLGPTEKAVLQAYLTVKEVSTRRSLFYKTYRAIPHWRDGRIHSSLNQSEAVTRRYSSSGPNVQQMPSRGEGARFREVILPHHRDAVVISFDFNGQELRLGAELSGDEAMTSCYVGDNKRDMHSLTAVAAAVQMWGTPVAYDEFQAMRNSDDPEVKAKAGKLRGDAKTVNFASQYGAMAAKIAETMMCDEETAQAFLDAREEAFPGIVAWGKEVAELAKVTGYALTMMGARRHLREALSAENQYDRLRAERQVGNFYIQGSAAEMTKLAMARVWERKLVTGKFDAVFYFPVHDELVFSVHKDQAYEFAKEVHACMVAKYSTMSIPLESSIAIGPNFSCDYEIGMTPDEDAINAVLNKIFNKETETA